MESHVNRLATCAAEIAEHYLALPVALPTPPVFAGPEVPDAADQHLMEIDGWAEALARQCAGLRDELSFLAPWLAAPTGGSRRRLHSSAEGCRRYYAAQFGGDARSKRRGAARSRLHCPRRALRALAKELPRSTI